MRLPPSCQTRWPSDSYRHLPNDVGVLVLGGFLSALRVCADALVGHSILRIERQAEATHVSCSRDRVNKRRCKRTYKQPHPSAKARQATRRVELRRKTIARMPPDSGRGAPAAPDGAATPKKKAWARPTAAGWAVLAGRVTPTAAPTTRCASATGSIASTRRRETCASTGTIRTAAPSSRRRAARRGDPDRVADRDDHLGHLGRSAPVLGGDEPRRGGNVRGPAHAPNGGPPGPTGEDAATDPAAAPEAVEASAATSTAMGVAKVNTLWTSRGGSSAAAAAAGGEGREHPQVPNMEPRYGQDVTVAANTKERGETEKGKEETKRYVHQTIHDPRHAPTAARKSR